LERRAKAVERFAERLSEDYKVARGQALFVLHDELAQGPIVERSAAACSRRPRARWP
jgi:hypothetical protein